MPLQRRGRAGYTRIVARLMRPLASLLAAVTTVATPAVLAACLALCMPGMSGHQMAVAADAAVASPDAGCPDHAVAAPAAPATAVAASAAACCIDGLTETAPSVTAERTGTRHTLTAALVPFVVWTPAPVSRVAPRVAHDRGSPPPSVRRPSVLRI